MALADPMNKGHTPGNGPLRAGGKPAKSLPKTGRDLPSTESEAVKRQMPAVTVARDLWAGNDKVKEMGTTYLPKAPRERPNNYDARLARSVFHNFYRRTIEALVGFVYRKDPVLGDDVPPIIVEHAENIDNTGTHLDVFARELMTDAMVTGHAAVLVEFANTGGRKLTVADERALGLRPYWVLIKKEQIVSWRTVPEQGRILLAQLVLCEKTVEADGDYGEAEVTRYRVFRRERTLTGIRVWFELLRIAPDKQVIVEDAGEYPTQIEIPVAEVPTNGKRGLFESDPPLADVGALNLAHYQVWSDYANSIHKTCVPLLFLAGFLLTDDKGKKVDIGPDDALNSKDGNAKAAYVTHGGESLAEVRSALDTLKADIGSLGLAMLAPQKQSAETLGAKRLDRAAESSALAVTVRGEQDALEKALGFHARYLGLPSGGSITLNREFEAEVLDAATITALVALCDTLGVKEEAIVEMLVRGGRLPEGTNVDEMAEWMRAARQQRQDIKLLEAEQAESRFGRFAGERQAAA